MTTVSGKILATQRLSCDEEEEEEDVNEFLSFTVSDSIIVVIAFS
jgi:hypothetical protein